MFGKSAKIRHNPWGDDHPEKLSDSVDTPKTIGISKQIKGLFNPDNMLSQVTGEKTPSRTPEKKPQEKPKIKPNEILLFCRVDKESTRELHKETEMILSKLKEQITVLEKQEKGLSADLAKVKVESLPPKTGIYYVRFLEWLLIVVRSLRLKVEQGRAWLETFNKRKKKKMGYWQKYKKHGTTFGLSHERTVATQTG